MAHSLNDLITSLATILIRYHDSQKINVCIKETEPTAMKKASREYAMKLLQSVDFDQEFARLNVECTKQYADFKRIDLLTFIKDEIKILKEVSLRTTPFLEADDESTNSEFDDYKNKIAMLLTDFKGLLNTQKANVYEARIKKFNDPIVTKWGLHGMIDSVGVSNMFGMLKSSHLCNSGDLVKVELLDRFNLTELSTSTEIKIVAELICEGHQHALMAARHRELQTTIHELKEQHSEERSRLNTELQHLEKKLKETEEKLQQLQNIINELQQKIEANAQERKMLEAKLNETEEALKEAEARISKQGAENEKLQQEIKALREEKVRQVIPNGLMPFYARPSPLLFYQNFNRAINEDQGKQPSTTTSPTVDL
ncbi:MAG: hypothetical protein P4L79_12300 [Legionella sp.]|uniref:hypothetical protein n=1 Tax=Legionella sp. TaxID=459 RepID=UPI002851E476|nr:hypothetical protein [Legionella sp.]